MIIKIAVAAIVGALTASWLKGMKPEIGQVFLLGLSMYLIYYVVGYIQIVKEMVAELAGQVSIDQRYLEILVKMIGIAYVSEFASNLCKDSGCTTIATQVETIGKMSMFLLSLPILMSLTETIGRLL